MENRTRRFYNDIAGAYHRFRISGNAPNNEFLVNPAALKLIGNVKGKRILDLGCGTGIVSKQLQDKGGKVSGIDLSPEMIGIAKEYAPGIDFKIGSVMKLPYRDSSFDCVLALLVMNYVPDFDKALSEVWRVTKLGGYFVAAVGNPVVSATHSVKDKQGKRIDYGRVRRFDRYFTERIVSSNWSFEDINTGKKHDYVQRQHHITYQTLIKGFLRNRFAIVDYIDPAPIKGYKGRNSRSFYNYSRSVPNFCIFKLKKVAEQMV